MKRRIPLSQPIKVTLDASDVPIALQMAVIAALRWAWAKLRLETSVDPMASSEEEITNELEKLLNCRHNGRRRAQMLRLFETVERSGQHRAAGTSFKQTPDLVFRPRTLPKAVVHSADWGIFAECKIIEAPNHSPGKYCTDGIQRFVRGDYAPWMSHGLMIAYVRDGRTPTIALTALLTNAYETLALRSDEEDEHILRTTHDRSNLPTPCATIEIVHLWLDARAVPSPFQLTLQMSS